MFEISYNRALLGLELETVTPLSIRAGDIGLEPGGCDLVCTRTRHALHGRTVFIPGSSLKGVLRSTIEAQLRGSLREGTLCNPLGKGACAGSARVKESAKSNSGPGVHASSCVACRLFGSTVLRGRCAVRDHFPFPPTAGSLSPEEEQNLAAANAVEVRPGIAIDRLSGAVHRGALFEQEMVPAGVKFSGDLLLENFQAWQVGAIFGVIRDLDDGFAQLGSGKTKGLGVVRARIVSLVLEQRAEAGEPDRPKAAGELMRAEQVRAYGLYREPPLPAAAGQRRGIRDRFQIPAGDLPEWSKTAAEALRAVVSELAA